MALNPVVFTEKIVRSFLRYQLTAYPFADEQLLEQMRELLSLDATRNSPLLKGPFVSVSRPFRRGAAVDQLIAEGVFHPHMRQRIPAEITHVYGHQDEAIRAIYSGQTTLVSLMGADGRFFPLPQGCLLILLARGIDYEVINSQITRIAMISLLAIYSFMFVSHAKSALAFRPSNVDAILAGVIQKAKESNSARILLVNAPDIYSSPRYVLKYHRFNGDLDFLYNSTGSCGPYPRYTLLNKEESSGLAHVIRPMKDKTPTLPSEGCNPEIAFNGYAVKQTDNKGINDDVDSFFVSGNQFRFSRAQRGSPKKLKSINISRQYDAIYVANYETEEVRLLAPVDGAS